MEFRALNADEIDVRVQNITKDGSGVILLLYKDARVDMNILDETVGSENWQREHYECKGNLFCKVGIRTKGGDWVWKSDCGIESNAEAKKGEASDSFKRACFNVGIGRELYTAPFIFVPSSKCNIRNGKCSDHFSVEKIVITKKVITAISIINESIKSDKQSDRRCFVWMQKKPEEQK